MDTKSRILTAATRLFARKGKSGVTMEEIATAAQVNKAMVYYYYNDKENLYKEVVKSSLSAIGQQMAGYLQTIELDECDTTGIVKHFIRAYFQAVSRNVDFVKIIGSVLTNEPEIIQYFVDQWAKEPLAQMPVTVLKTLESGISNKHLRSINAKQVLISIIGMNLFYFIGKPIAEVFLDLDVEDEELFLQERLTSILDLVLYGIVERRSV